MLTSRITEEYLIFEVTIMVIIVCFSRPLVYYQH